MILKQAIIVFSNNSKVIRTFSIQSLFNIYIVSDRMRRESAIAKEYWHETFKHDKNDRMEVTLRNIEQK